MIKISELTDNKAIIIGNITNYLYSIQNKFNINIFEYNHDEKLLIDILSLKDLVDYYGGCDENKRLNKYELEIDDITYDFIS